MKQTTKKPAAAERKTAIERPHKYLIRIQEEVADLASDILLNGGAQEDVDSILTALLRHRYKRLSFARGLYAAKPDELERKRMPTQTTLKTSTISISANIGRRKSRRLKTSRSVQSGR
jgi:hypothetical protein